MSLFKDPSVQFCTTRHPPGSHVHLGILGNQIGVVARYVWQRPVDHQHGRSRCLGLQHDFLLGKFFLSPQTVLAMSHKTARLLFFLMILKSSSWMIRMISTVPLKISCQKSRAQQRQENCPTANSTNFGMILVQLSTIINWKPFCVLHVGSRMRYSHRKFWKVVEGLWGYKWKCRWNNS